MFGAIYVGLSGLQTYSKGLQQVSNNVSNLNTLGFKATTVTFANVHAGRDSGGLSYQGTNNGNGGVSLGQSSLDFRAGELRQTEKDLDLAVQGTGFLVLLKGTETRYLRTGSFEVDKDGYVVLAGSDWRLATLDGAGRPVALSIDNSRTNAPVKTTKIDFADNLSSTATSFGLNDISVYDANGLKHVWQIAFSRTEGSTDWTLKVTDDKARTIGERVLKFVNGAVSSDTQTLTFADADNGLSVVFDFSVNVTSFSSGTVSTLRAASVDGHAVGALTTLAVNTAGELDLTYSNNEKKTLGAVAVADFRDPGMLEQESGGLFANRVNSEVEYVSSEDPRAGQVMGRRLEASNVDLSREFGDLILIQRGYQASSQIVSVSNEMIQQLFGIRGQG